ncbi:MAG: hypothetical protein IPO87_10695 [Flavobacteriales bacterium]|nr:hypothetical protein [Flavobacteriales bacterium]
MTLGEFGEPADRFRCYNTGSEDLLLKEGSGSFPMQDPTTRRNSNCPKRLCPHELQVLVWCDKVDDASLGIHTNFTLAQVVNTLCFTIK